MLIVHLANHSIPGSHSANHKTLCNRLGQSQESLQQTRPITNALAEHRPLHCHIWDEVMSWREVCSVEDLLSLTTLITLIKKNRTESNDLRSGLTDCSASFLLETHHWITESHWAAPETCIHQEPRPSDETKPLSITALTKSATMWLNAKLQTAVWKHVCDMIAPGADSQNILYNKTAIFFLFSNISKEFSNIYFFFLWIFLKTKLENFNSWKECFFFFFQNHHK